MGYLTAQPHKAIWTVILLIAVVFIFNNQTALSQADNQAGDFVQTNGWNLSYRGQNIILKGTNFDNINALGAQIGNSGQYIGNSDITAITITEQDYQMLSQLGGNTVRFGLDYMWYADNRSQYYAVLDQHVEWARQHNLWIVWNLFNTPGNCYEGYSNHCGFWNSPSEQQALEDFWLDMANHYRDNTTVIGYGLLNEPTPPAPNWSATWFDIAQGIRDAIMQVDSNHLIFIAATSDAYFGRTFGSNVVYEVHDYTPISLTHADSNSGVQYPGNATNWDGSIIYWDKARLEQKLREETSVNWAQQNNVPLFVGEWATRSTYPGYEDYVRDKAELYNEIGIHHTTYTWRHDPGYWKWGVFNFDGPLVVTDQAKLDGYILSWQGGGQPNNDGNPLPPTSVPPTTAPPTSVPPTSIAPTNLPPTSVPPTNQPPSGPPPNTAFYRGVNLGGPALTVNGDNWDQGTTAPNNGFQAENPWMTTVPATEDSMQTMLQSYVEHWDLGISIPNIENGTYAVSVYSIQSWNNPDPARFNVFVEGQFRTDHKASPNVGGEWSELGPWTVQVTDGELNLSFGGLTTIAGIEVRRQAGGGRPTPTSQPTNEPTVAPPTNTPMPTIVPPTNEPTTVPPTNEPTVVPPTNTPVPTIAPPTNEPTTVPGNSNGEFYRGVNIGGQAIVIAGNQWEASQAASPNGNNIYSKWMTPNPATDENTATMLKKYKQHWALSMKLDNVAPAEYWVTVYTVQSWNNPNPASFSINAEGVTVGNHAPTPNQSGEWKALGPWRVAVTDGQFNLNISGHANIAGFELRIAGDVQPPTNTPVPTNVPNNTPVPTNVPNNTPVPTNTVMPTVAPTNTPGTPVVNSFYRGINLGGPQIVIDGNQWDKSSTVTTNGIKQANRWLDVVPATDNNTQKMLQRYLEHWNMEITVTQVANGTYELYMYNIQSWDNPNPPTYSVIVDGQVLGTYNPQPNLSGDWQRLGPWTVQVVNGQLDISVQGLTNMAGLELYSTGVQTIQQSRAAAVQPMTQANESNVVIITDETEVLPTIEPTVVEPTDVPSTVEPTVVEPIVEPTSEPTVVPPTVEPTVVLPTIEPTIVPPTVEPTVVPPTIEPTVEQPVVEPTVEEPAVQEAVEETVEEPTVQEAVEESITEPASEDTTESTSEESGG